MELRWASAHQLNRWLLSVYDACKDQDDNIFDNLSYDWEVVPIIMNECLKDGYPCYLPEDLPDPEKVKVKIINTIHRNIWFNDAARACQCLWEYPELVSDHRDEFRSEMEDGVMPMKAAEKIGSELKLIKVESYFGTPSPTPYLQFNPVKHKIQVTT